MDDLDARRTRAAHNQSLFREVNERIASLSHGQRSAATLNAYICECLDDQCTSTLELTHGAYERLRERGTRFLVLPGHNDPAVEDIVEAGEHYLIVEKIGVAADVAMSMDPRKVESAA